MKVRITRLYFDGLKRHRVGTVLNISDAKYKTASEIPKTSRKKIGDYKEFASSCMEIVDEDTQLVNVNRPRIIDRKALDADIIGPSGDEKSSDREVI